MLKRNAADCFDSLGLNLLGYSHAFSTSKSGLLGLDKISFSVLVKTIYPAVIRQLRTVHGPVVRTFILKKSNFVWKTLPEYAESLVILDLVEPADCKVLLEHF